MVCGGSSYMAKLFELPFISLESRFLELHLKRMSTIQLTMKNVFLLQRYEELFFGFINFFIVTADSTIDFFPKKILPSAL